MGDEHPPRAPLLSEPQISAGPLTLHAIERGSRGGPPVLYLHGWLDHAHSFDWLIDALPASWRHVALDFRGHGESSHQSEGGTYPMPTLLADLDFTIEQLNLSPVHLVAHSMGSAAAFLYSAVRPERVRSLTAIDNLGVSGGPPESVIGKLREALEGAHKPLRKRSYASLEDAVARVRENNPGFSEKVARHLTQFGTERLADGRVQFRFDPAHRRWSGFTLDEAQLLAILRAVRCPTQIIRGSRGHVLDDARLSARLEALGNPAVHLVEGGHHVHLDAPVEVARWIEPFIHPR